MGKEQQGNSLKLFGKLLLIFKKYGQKYLKTAKISPVHRHKRHYYNQF